MGFSTNDIVSAKKEIVSVTSDKLTAFGHKLLMWILVRRLRRELSSALLRS